MDWLAWHAAYDDPASALSARLRCVRSHLSDAVGRAPAGLGLPGVEVRRADAGLVSGFADVLPADVLLLCGIFGNVSDRDIRRTIHAVPALCRAGATVIWTRHRRPPDLTSQIRAWFAAAGLGEIAFDAPGTSTLAGVGVHRLGCGPAAGLPGGRLFTFLAT